MCTAQLSRQAANELLTTYQPASRENDAARAAANKLLTTYGNFLDQVIAATVAAPAPRTVAAAVAEVAKPAAPLPVVKPAPAAPVATARRSTIESPRLQKLATKQIAAGRYAFEHCGIAAEVANSAEGWRLTIAGTPGNRRYETKRHAVNAARLVMESQAAAKSAPAAIAAPKPAPAPLATVKPAAAEISRPAPATVAPPAPAARVNWRSENAPWRRERMTPKQARLLGHLYGKMTACGLSANSPLASKVGINRGEASDLIDSLKSQLGGYARQPPKPGVAVYSCSIGPFVNGHCEVCGLVQSN